MEKRYKDYPAKVQNWMRDLEYDLQDELGEIPKSYIAQLDVLADAYFIYYQSLKAIKDEGLIITGARGKEKIKNPAVSSYNSSALLISKLLNQLLATRSSKTKLKQDTNTGEEDNSPICEFL